MKYLLMEEKGIRNIQETKTYQKNNFSLTVFLPVSGFRYQKTKIII